MRIQYLITNHEIKDGDLIRNILNGQITHAITDANPFKDWQAIELVLTSEERLNLQNDERDWKAGDLLLDGDGKNWCVLNEKVAVRILERADTMVIQNVCDGFLKIGDIVSLKPV